MRRSKQQHDIRSGESESLSFGGGLKEIEKLLRVEEKFPDRLLCTHTHKQKHTKRIIKAMSVC
jgi:hypothetical protein